MILGGFAGRIGNAAIVKGGRTGQIGFGRAVAEYLFDGRVLANNTSTTWVPTPVQLRHIE